MILRKNRQPIDYLCCLFLLLHFSLNGSVVDDELPAGGQLVIEWRQAFGPGTTTFTDATASATTATFDTPGRYTLELVASDGIAEVVDQLDVQVASPCEPPLDGVVAWWPAEGNGNEVIGGNDAELAGVDLCPGCLLATPSVRTMPTHEASFSNRLTLI